MSPKYRIWQRIWQRTTHPVITFSDFGLLLPALYTAFRGVVKQDGVGYTLS